MRVYNSTSLSTENLTVQIAAEKSLQLSICVFRQLYPLFILDSCDLFTYTYIWLLVCWYSTSWLPLISFEVSILYQTVSFKIYLHNLVKWIAAKTTFTWEQQFSIIWHFLVRMLSKQKCTKANSEKQFRCSFNVSCKTIDAHTRWVGPGEE